MDSHDPDGPLVRIHLGAPAPKHADLGEYAFQQAYAKVMAGVTMAQIGHVSQEEVLEIKALTGETVLKVPIAELKEAWQKPLRW